MKCARSYHLLALLEVCAAQVTLVAASVKAVRQRQPGELAVTLQLAISIAGEIHDAIEKAPAIKAVAS